MPAATPMLWTLSAPGMKDMNALSFASDGFYRSTDRVAPHNLYTSADKLTALMKRLGFWGSI